MEATAVWGLTVAELESALHEVDARVLLVPPRILRRVIKQDRQVPGPGLRVPHRKTYVISRQPLLEIAELAELGLPPETVLPDRLILIARPEPEALLAMIRPRALAKYWRLFFHARVHLALADRIAGGQLTPTDLARRIEALGATAFDEIRLVLRSEDLLLPPVTDPSVYEEFVAVFLELKYFAPALLPSYFPTLDDLAHAEAVVSQDVDHRALYAQTELPEATEIAEDEADGDEAGLEARVEHPIMHAPKQSERTYCRIMERADRSRARGNLVRSALLRWRATRLVGPKLARSARSEARHDLERLVRRLRAALELPDQDSEPWADALAALLPSSTHGLWTPEARLLYDLQKVCVDHERGVFKLDLFGWLRSWGRSPLKRPLPAQRRVLMVKHLHGAQQRLKAVRVASRKRGQLAAMLESAVAATEHRLADYLRPLVVQALDDVGLVPANVPERVARSKLSEELIDLIVRRGYLTMGDLRDAISRNNLKLRDVGGVMEVLSGDQLLQADGKLAVTLDGVHSRGEVYLRLPQMLSSLAFGTQIGRFLTLYVILPFGGSFMILEALQHLQHLAVHWGLVGDAESHTEQADQVLTTPGLSLVVLLGLFLIGLLYHTAFRRSCLTVLRWTYLAGRWLVRLPMTLLDLPWVRRLLASRWVQWFRRYALKPLVFSGMTIVALSVMARHELTLSADLGIFLSMNLLLNSRLGRNVDEFVTDWVVRSWHHLKFRVFAALFRFITDSFHQLLEALERFLYTVDEWLRFRSGENRLTVATKAFLGMFWAVVAYVVRFIVNLLIEPQVNPIKHFPVVTVSHKIIFPLGFPVLKNVMVQHFGLSEAEAASYAGLILFGIPGIFGFLVWELKENWRLYAANRLPNLCPVLVGRHGETIPRLLRPGFHSGTLPKLFTRLRRADRRAHYNGKWTASRKYQGKIEEVAVDVRNLVDRELVALLEQSESWPTGALHVAQVRVGLNNVRVELCSTRHRDRALWITFEERWGRLLVWTSDARWLEELADDARMALTKALTGLFKMSGVDLEREHLATLVPGEVSFEVVEDGLSVRLQSANEPAWLYDLEQSPNMVPQPQGQVPLESVSPPVLPRRQVLFSEIDIRWTDWVTLWSSAPGAFRPAPFGGSYADRSTHGSNGALAATSVSPAPAEPV